MSILIRLYVLSGFEPITFQLPNKKKLIKALLRLTVINKHKVSQNLGKFFELVQSIVDIDNLYYCFIFFCSEESYLNVGWFVQIVLFDCGTQPADFVCCYFIYSIRDVELLVHNWFFARFGFIIRYKCNIYRIVINGITDCRYCFSFFFTKIDLLWFFKLSQIINF